MNMLRKSSLFIVSAVIIFTLSACGSSAKSGLTADMSENGTGDTKQPQQSLKKKEKHKKGPIDVNFKENVPSVEEFEEAEKQTEKYLKDKYDKDFSITTFATYYEYDKNNVQQFKEFVGSAIIAFDDEDLDIVVPIRVDKYGNVIDEYEASLPQGTVYQSIEKEVKNFFGDGALIAGQAQVIADENDEAVTETDIDVYIPVNNRVDVNEESKRIEEFNEYLVHEQYANKANLHIYYVTQDFLDKNFSTEEKEQLSQTDVLIPLVDHEEVEGVVTYIAYDIDSNLNDLMDNEIVEELTQHENM